MPDIVKTRAIALNKLNYGDTSKIVSLFSEDYGKMSAIIKGARSPKSKMGALVDIMNIVEVVFYKKQNRDVQLITQVELINHFPRIKEDLNKLKYASGIIELVSVLTVDLEPHEKLFKGTDRILNLIDLDKEKEILLFAKYFLFFLKEIGYEFELNRCTKCSCEIDDSKSNYFDYQHGILCNNCGDAGHSFFQFSPELFKILTCISTRNCEIEFRESDLETVIRFFERYLMHQVHEFKGLKSLKMF